jgi:prephenate dehydratase/prephenate dehydrogenase
MQKIISIIGGTGKMGSLFAKALSEKGHKVIISGRTTKITPIEAAKRADIVIISVPIRETERVIKEISPYVKKEAILTDFTSIKINPCKIMEKDSKAEVIGGHPVFGPNVNIERQPFVICPIRAKQDSIEKYREILQSIGLNVFEMTPEEHDRKMGIIQAMNQFANLSFANALKNLKFDLSKRDLFSPAFNLKLNILERMLSQEPYIYADIETMNPYAEEYSKAYSEAMREIKKCIDSKDNKALERKIEEMQEYFGKKKEEILISTEKATNIPKTIEDASHKIAILGPEYSYCHILAKKIFPNAEFLLCNNIEEIFKLVSKEHISLGLSPIENMLHGSVREAIYSLKKYNVKINRLLNMPIPHCIASKSKDFKKIISHTQALSQCSEFLKDFKERNYEILETSSTSKAMELASSNPEFAAIGSTEAAGHYGLNIIKENIEDDHNNITSFIQISKEENKEVSGKNVRTSILISPDSDKPGLLYEILATFKKNNINLTKIESIPTGNKIGEYIFYVEFNGSLHDENVQLAMDVIKSLHNVYSFGSYTQEDA